MKRGCVIGTSTYITGLEVESCGVEVERLCKIRDAHAEMTEFVHRRRTFFSPKMSENSR